uniref:Uncharacterized protein n=1 Tax=Gongylonema pulchrum TaxID=637853 RepID=A0A183DDN0_9BILA
MRVISNKNNEDVEVPLFVGIWSFHYYLISLPPLEPIAIARVLPDADHLTALAGQNENEVLVSICTVYFKIAVYRINLSFILNGARMMQDVEENSSSSDVSDP